MTTQRFASLSRFALGAAAFGFLTACQDKPQPPPKFYSSVRVQKALSSEVAQTVRIAGALEARNSTNLGFRVGGRVVERLVDVGDRVRAGQVLARLDPQLLNADAQAAQAGLAAAEAQIRQAAAAYDRQQTLLARGFTTRSNYDAALEALRRAQSSRDSLTAQLAMARDQAAQSELISPGDGVISARNLEVGQVVQAAATVYTLVSDGPIDAVFDAPEEALRLTLMGARVEIALLDAPNVKAEGRIRQIAPGVDAATGAVRVKVGIDAPPRAMTLGAAVSGTMALEAHPFILLPATALASDPQAASGVSVWIVNPADSTVSMRLVTVERYETDRVALSGGVSPGEEVVVSGAQFLRPGQKVEIVRGGGS